MMARHDAGLHGAEAFSPALLRIHLTPPRPLPRVVLGLHLVLLAAALLWAALARLDTIAVASGKLIPQSQVKIVQPAEAGIVREILVREGDHVRQGTLLLRMDMLLLAADLESLRRELRRKKLNFRRIQAEIHDLPLLAEEEDPPALFQEMLALYTANRAALQAALAHEQSALDRASQERQAARITQTKWQQILPLYKEQESSYQQLESKGYAARLMSNETTRKRIEQEKDLQVQEVIIAREEASMEQSRRRMEQLRQDYVRQLHSELSETKTRLEQLEQEIAKQSFRHDLMELRAPHEGVVKELATHTIGAVVQPGTILMTLVPVEEGVKAEVWLSNEDRGFVLPGQEVHLKMAAYPFQKYGMVQGWVEQVAADSSDRPEEGKSPRPTLLPYRVVVAFKEKSLLAHGVSLPLDAGMQTVAEIRLGERSVLDYLLSPVLKTVHEAGREK